MQKSMPMKISLDDISEKVILESNDTDVALSRKPVYVSILEQYELLGEKNAVVGKNATLSYRKLIELSFYIKDIILSKYGRDDLHVGVLLEREVYMVGAVLGVWLAGGVYVPIDKNMPKARRDYIVKDAGVNLLLIDDDESYDGDILTINMKELFEQWDMESVAWCNKSYNLKEEIAYIIYTSGSTGYPKGVAISHLALSNCLNGFLNEIPLKEEDKMLFMTSIGFDISILEMFLPLLAGAAVYIITSEDKLDGEKLYNYILENEINTIQATPMMWRMIYDIFCNKEKKEILLDKALCGGENYEVDLVKQLQCMAHNVINVYGPTETTIWSTIYHFPKVAQEICIGKPIANTKVLIVNEDFQIVPIGVPGQILIGGLGVFLEYYKNTVLTRESIVSIDGWGKYYKTGDWGYWDENGDIHFIGRKDAQIKFKGYRIELTEIEKTINRYENVCSSAAVLINEQENYYIGILIVLKNGGKKEEEDVEKYIKATLPEYMVPTCIVFAEQMPLTYNQKIDRREVKNIVCTNRGKEKANMVCSDEIEYKIKQIWKKVLGNEVTNSQVAFFDCGGNSLTLNRMRVELEKCFERNFNIIDLLKYNTIEKIRVYLLNDENIKSKSSENTKTEIDRKKRYLNRYKK